MLNSIFRLPKVMAETGYSRSTIYLRISQVLWPKPISLGPNSIGWASLEVEQMNACRIAGKSDEEIRMLVRTLEEGRQKPRVS